MVSSASSGPRLARICLVKKSFVVSRGVAHQRYRIRLNDGWIDAEQHPSAKLAQAASDAQASDGAEPFVECGPGEQYRCEIELLLPVGTLVEKVVTAPALPEPSSELKLSDWLRFRHPPRRRIGGTSNCMFVVKSNYLLVPAAKPLAAETSKPFSGSRAASRPAAARVSADTIARFVESFSRS